MAKFQRTPPALLRRRLRAGTLVHRVTIQNPVRVKDSATGAERTTYPDVATIAASIEPLPGREGLIAGVQGSDMTHLIRCWPHASINPATRFEFVDRDAKTRHFHVGSPKNIKELNREMEILAKERFKTEA